MQNLHLNATTHGSNEDVEQDYCSDRIESSTNKHRRKVSFFPMGALQGCHEKRATFDLRLDLHLKIDLLPPERGGKYLELELKCSLEKKTL